MTVPLRAWLVEESGRRGKLWLALQLIDSTRGHRKDARLLIDARFIRRNLILAPLERRARIIGRVRRDTASVYFPPQPESPRRGRKRNDGLRIDATVLAGLPAMVLERTLHCKVHPVRVRPAIALARILRGLPVRVVWREMRQSDNALSRATPATRSRVNSECLSRGGISICGVESGGTAGVVVESLRCGRCHGLPPRKFRPAGGGVCFNFSQGV